MKTTLTASFFLILCLSSYSQPSIEWQRSLGGSDQEGLTGRNQLAKTSDGGYIIAAYSYSNDGDLSGHHGLSATSDCWVVKVDSLGNIEWSNSLGGSAQDQAYCAIQTSNGGYLFLAYTSSIDGDVTGYHADSSGAVYDIWMVKLDTSGNIQWQKCFGGTSYDIPSSVIESYDGSFVAVGNTSSDDGDASGHHEAGDIWIIKVSPTGTLLWQKCLGGTSTESGASIKETPDSGFVICGTTESTDGDFTGADSSASNSTYIMKIDSLANLQWVKTFGGDNIDFGQDIELTADGGYLLANGTFSSDIPGYHGNLDYWLVKLDDAGNIQWQNCYGGSAIDALKDLAPAMDNGFILLGESFSTDGDVANNIGITDVWVVKIDSLGNIEWNRSYGGTGQEFGGASIMNADGSILFIAESKSNDVDVSGHHGATNLADVWVVKLGSLMTGLNDRKDDWNSLTLYPNPTDDQVVISFDLAARERVRIELFDMSGRLICSIVDEGRSAGRNVFLLDLETLSLEEGIYLIKSTIGQTNLINKLIKN